MTTIIQLVKGWSTIDRLSVIWKSHLSDKIRRIFFKATVLSILLYGCTSRLSEWRKSLTEIVQECYDLYWTNAGSNIPQNSSCTVTYLPSLKPFKLDEQDMGDTAGELRVNSNVTFSCGPLHTDEQKLDDQVELNCSSSVHTQNVILRTRWMQYTIETNEEGKSGKSVLAARRWLWSKINDN